MKLEDLIEHAEQQFKFWEAHIKLLHELKEMQNSVPELQQVQKDHLEMLLRLQDSPAPVAAEPTIPEMSNRGKWVFGPDRASRS